MARHVIQQQILDLELDSQENATQQQDGFKSLYYQQLVPGLEKLFDEIAGDDVLIRLDKLTVDLGDLDPGKNWDNPAMANQCLNLIREQVIAQAATQRMENIVSDTSVTEAGGRVEALVFYLNNGYFPWWGKIIEVDAAVHKLVDELQGKLAGVLKPVLYKAHARRRLTLQLSAKTLYRLLIGLMGNDAEALIATTFQAAQQLLDGFGTAPENKLARPESSYSGKPADVPAEIRELVWEVLLTVAAEKTHLSRVAQQQWIKTELQNRLHERGAIQLPKKQKEDSHSRDEATDAASPDELEPPHQTQRAGVGADPAQAEADQAGPEVDKQADSQGNDKKEAGRNQSNTNREATKSDDPWAQSNNDIYIGNAGLVLLVPFIPAFFAKVGLINDGKWAHEAARERGALLLQFLCSGKAEAEETQLALNKIICGLRLEDPVPASIEMTVLEHDKAISLLESVISYWTILGKSTPEGLRAGFLLREARLKPGDEGWLLRVQQHTHDILLDSLPWGFGVTQTPWMLQPIHVEWV